MRIFREPGYITVEVSLKEVVSWGYNLAELHGDPTMAKEFLDEVMLAIHSKMGIQFDSGMVIEVAFIPDIGYIFRFNEVYISRETAKPSEKKDAPSYDFEEKDITYDIALYSFDDIENVIGLAHQLKLRGINRGALYHYKEKYYLRINILKSKVEDCNRFRLIMSEYGDKAKIPASVLKEQGKVILGSSAVRILTEKFSN